MIIGLRSALMPRTVSHLVPVCILVALIAVCYANVLTGAFLWDDDALIVRNESIRTLDTLPALFSPHAWPGDEGLFYRPLQLVLYAGAYAVWRDCPTGYHVINVLLHTINTVLLYYLIISLGIAAWAAWAGCVVFAVHPLATEAVSYISGTADPLVLMSMLMMVIVQTRVYQQLGVGRRAALWWGVPLVGVLYGGAILSKEIGQIMMLIVPLWHLMLVRRTASVQRQALPFMMGSIIVCGLITMGYWLVRQHAGGYPAMDIYAFTAAERLRVGLAAFARYWMLMAVPLHLHMEHILLPPPVMSVAFWGALAWFSVVMAAGAVLVWRRPLAGMGFLWFLVTLLPVLNLVPLNATFSEHWLYIPFVGLCLCLAAAGDGMRRWQWVYGVYATVLVLFVVGCSVRTIMRNTEWREPERFYQQTLHYNPDNVKILYNLGTLYVREHRYDEALSVFSNAATITVERELRTAGKGAAQLLAHLQARVYNNMGTAYIYKGDRVRARACFERALRANPGHASARANLARLGPAQ